MVEGGHDVVHQALRHRVLFHPAQLQVVHPEHDAGLHVLELRLPIPVSAVAVAPRRGSESAIVLRPIPMVVPGLGANRERA